jgi:hypothetical protein
MSPYPSPSQLPPVADPLEQRRDLRQRDIVARGIALMRESGILCAVEFLKRHAVKPQVIERVLLDPVRGAPA